MRILFVHQNFPAQYLHLAHHYAADKSSEVLAISSDAQKRRDIVKTFRYPAAAAFRRQDLALSRHFAGHVARAEAVAGESEKLRKAGFVPDIILGHCGWGETLFLKDVWPSAKLIVYAEYFYGGRESDMNFDPEFQTDDLQARLNSRARNASLLSAVVSADRGLSPTQWQRRRFPIELQSKIEVIHDGIETDKLAPNAKARVTLERQGLSLRPGDETITFINRNLEPYRGYHIFMRALPKILSDRPNARAIIVGGDDVSYGAAAPKGRKWRNIFLQEVKDKLDISRIHFVGRVPYDIYRQILQVSSVHIYLTYPFVLSWSMLEAMSAGCLVIGSDTAPVREVVQHHVTGLLVDFFNPDALARHAIEALSHPERFAELRAAARRKIVEEYDLKRVCLPRQTRLISRLAGPSDPMSGE